jgi:predicted metalloprotease with PDZ domain
MSILLPVLLAMLAAPAPLAIPEISYSVSIPQPHTHLFHVEMQINDIEGPDCDLSMPVWTPGSYLVREYARQVEQFTVSDDSGRPRSWRKIDKNTWRVAADGARNLRVSYVVYGRENGIRFSYVNADHGHILGISLFMFADGHIDRPVSLKLSLPTGWRVSNGCFPDPSDPFLFRFADYHELVDSPMLIGTHDERTFTVREVPHVVAMVGETDADRDQIVENCRKIVEAGADLMGSLPYRKYCFILRFGGGGGGLEHANGTTMGTSRWGHDSERARIRLAGLTAHEYFHAWNVKYVKPREFVPYDYDQEMYTDALWFYEGATSWFGGKLMLKTGLVNNADFFGEIASSVASYRNTPGRAAQSAVEASFDTWIKQYRQDENSSNAQVSYYEKGELIGMVLDLEMLQRTGGRVGLDDVMREMVRETAAGRGGFSTREIASICSRLAGSSLDDFFERYVYGVEEIPFEQYLDYAGYHLAPNESLSKRDNKGGYLGARVDEREGRVSISRVTRETPAWRTGLEYGDEIIAVNGVRTPDSEEFERQMKRHAPGVTVQILVAREGLMRQFDVTLAEHPQPVYSILPVKQPTPAQLAIRARWPVEGAREGAVSGAAFIAGGLPAEL